MLPKEHFESLDVVRGLAAIAVVLGHWNTLYYSPLIDRYNVDAITWPLGRLSLFFYQQAARGTAVDLFFCLSGFIFFQLYLKSIRTGRVSAWKFAVLRFSRLYPLHFVMLLTVGLLEVVDFHQRGMLLGWMPHDDLFHFILQLGFASNWWPNSPQSFNGPIWSVSIEVLLYALFFIAAKSALLQPKSTAMVVVIGFLLTHVHFALGEGLAMFFIGGLCSYLVQATRRQLEVTFRQVAVIVCCTIFAVLVIFKATHRGLGDWFLLSIVFPGLIVFLACMDQRIEHWVRPFQWLGSISYSMYLIHIPLMLLTMLLGLAYPASPIFLVLFMAVLIGLSLASFRLFEFPAQQFLRGALLSKFIPPQTETARRIQFRSAEEV